MLTYALVVSVPKENLPVLCLGFNLPVLLRKPGQPSLHFYVALCCVAKCVRQACVRKRAPQARYNGDTSLGCSQWGFYLFVPILDTTTCFQHRAPCITHGARVNVSLQRSWSLLHTGLKSCFAICGIGVW